MHSKNTTVTSNILKVTLVANLFLLCSILHTTFFKKEKSKERKIRATFLRYFLNSG